MNTNTQNNRIERSPVVAIMGHIDHGKSTLLSYIRKSTKALNEAGGITQHVSAYEVKHTNGEGKERMITFLDTPGHEAFSGIRKRGAQVADIVVLVVSAEDGVKPQTVEAYKSIKESETPYIVAINKIDKPDANIERTKQSLAENEIYVEGYGGDIPVINISAKTGDGIPELLDMILLVADISELYGNPNVLAVGAVVESNRDIQKGISATCIIKNGTLKKGMFVASGKSIAPVRIMENFLGKQITEATFSNPIKIIGWDSLPEVGSTFVSFESKEEALEYVREQKEKYCEISKQEDCFGVCAIPFVIKADTAGSLEAVLLQIKKLANEKIMPKVVASGLGPISENDIALAQGTEKAIVIGFNVKAESRAKNMADKTGIEIESFDIIYKLTEWMDKVLCDKTPKIKTEESTGTAKILKVFSKTKDKQIVGCRVEKGTINVGAQIKIRRRDDEIGEGKIKGMELQKNKTSEVSEGKECGAMIESKIEIAPGDYIESFIIVEK